MKNLSKLTIVGVLGFSVLHAADITALTDATVKLIKNQTNIQKDLQNVHSQINVLDAKIQKNTILVKNAIDLANKAQKTADKFKKDISSNKTEIKNLKEENQQQHLSLKKILEQLSSIKQEMLQIKSSISVNQKETNAKIELVQKNLLTRINDVKTALETQLKIMKENFDVKLNKLNIAFNNKLKENAKNIQLNTVNLNALRMQHKNDISIIKEEFNNKLESFKKVLQGEIDIITAKLQGLGPIVVVNEGENKPLKNVPVKCQKKSCKNKNEKVKNADSVIQNFLNK